VEIAGKTVFIAYKNRKNLLKAFSFFFVFLFYTFFDEIFDF